MKLNIKDETFTHEVYYETTIDLETEITSVSNIIKARVLKELDNYDNPNNLMSANQIERALNTKIDKDKQIDLALKAFENNSYFILIDDIQAKSLDQIVVIDKNTSVSFMKLTPLIGG